MENPFQHLALSLSGGGYRAAAFHLGTMSYLEHLGLLERVEILSTVSGGTLTGIGYALSKARGEKFDDFYQRLNRGMSEHDLIEEALTKLSKGAFDVAQKNKNLINAFAELYQEKFFDGQQFGFLWEREDQLDRLKHVIFNATDFSYGKTFRFQYSKQYPDLSGNDFLRVTDEHARSLRMGDVMAASSCFPAGFEPILFPHDFESDSGDELSSLHEKMTFKHGVGLMDGGIVDNQGINSALLAMRQEEKDEVEEQNEVSESALGKNVPDKQLQKYLFIISDVDSAVMDPFRYPERGSSLLSLSWFPIVGGLLVTLMLLVCLLLAVNWMTVSFEISWIDILWNVFAGLSIAVIVGFSVLYFLIGDFIYGLFQKIPKISSRAWPLLAKLPFGLFKWFIEVRVQSVYLMVNDVFMNQVRDLIYASVYSNPVFRKRRISNLLIDLVPFRSESRIYEAKESDASKHPKLLQLYEEARRFKTVAKNAFEMDTTLWFTQEDIESHKQRDLLACGRFTACFNILEFIIRNYPDALKDHDEKEEHLKEIRQLYEQAREDWEEFLEDPLWKTDWE